MWWFLEDKLDVNWWQTQCNSGDSETQRPKNERTSFIGSFFRFQKDFPEISRNSKCELPLIVASCKPVESDDESEPLLYAVVKHDFKRSSSDELSLTKGQLISVYDKSENDWWYGKGEQSEGWFPSASVHPIIEAENKQIQKPDLKIPLVAPYVSLVGPLDSSDIAQMEHPACSSSTPEYVIALYGYQAQNLEELSFVKGERLEILSKPPEDPDWWMAKNSLNQRGLVPSNFVEIGSQIQGTSTNFSKQPWYYGHISRAYAEVLLNAFGSVGDFLVRVSESTPRDLSLSVRAPGLNRHFKISVATEYFLIGHRKFYSMTDLIDYYKRCPIYTTPQGFRVFLGKPFKKP